jgi:hypothetical protein
MTGFEEARPFCNIKFNVNVIRRMNVFQNKFYKCLLFASNAYGLYDETPTNDELIIIQIYKSISLHNFHYL